MKNKKNILAVSLSLALANFFLALVPQISFAQTPIPPPRQYNSGVDKQIAQFLCTPSDASQDKTAASSDLYNCINKVYRFALVIAAVFGVFMLVIAGYIYMSAEGNEESVTKAKDILVTTIASLVILSSGFILLKFLNPDLIKFQPIQPPSVVGTDKWANVGAGQFQAIFEGTGGVTKSKIGSSGIAGCGSTPTGNNCADYTKSPYGFSGNPSQKTGQNTFLTKNLLDKLQKLKTKYPNLVINEAYPPTGDHSSSCHNDGSCADIGVNPKSVSEVNKLCQAIRDSNSGLNYINEYTTQNSGGFSPSQMPACQAPVQTSKATGGHLHVQ